MKAMLVIAIIGDQAPVLTQIPVPTIEICSRELVKLTGLYGVATGGEIKGIRFFCVDLAPQ